MLPVSEPQPQESLVVTGNTAHTRPENRAFYPALDGIRALAFLMVFAQHYLQLPWGWTGVDVFFVLSGFLITGILFDTCNDQHRVRNFYVRRTLRIFPLYFGVMLAIFLTNPLMHWQWNWKWLVWPAYLGNFARFIHPYNIGDPLQLLADFQPRAAIGARHLTLYLGHFWSLCVEEQFYLIWPWVVFWIRDRRKLLWVCGVTLPLCLAMRLFGQLYFQHWMLENEILFRVTPFRLDALLLGGFIALVLRGNNKEVLFKFVRIAFPISAGAVLLWLLFAPHRHLWQRPYPYPDWKFTWGLSAVDILSGLLILVALQSGSLAYRFFSLRPLRWIGRMSYGAYVLHDIPHPLYRSLSLMLAQHLDSRLGLGEHYIQIQAAVITPVMGLALTLFLAWLSFRYFESPFLELKEKWAVRTAK